VTGIVYRSLDKWAFEDEERPRPVSGVPLGGIDTGGLYIEGSGTFGYSSIFNHYCPTGGPLNTPCLGIGLGGKVWVLTTAHAKNYAGACRPTMGVPPTMHWGGNGVLEADAIDYWGHYPIADLQFKSSAPVSVGLRAWAPFIPGDSKTSNTPGAVFEVYLRNSSTTRQAGTLAFSFPGFKKHQSRNDVLGWGSLAVEPVLPEPHVERRRAPGGLSGTWVEDKGWGMSYVLGALEEENVRTGGGLGMDAPKWRAIEKGLPAIPQDSDDGGSSLAVGFSLEPDERKRIRIVLAWHAPEWEGNGNPGTGGQSIEQPINHHGPGNFTTGKRFTHMYASRFADAGEVATFLARNHESLLKRIISWQSVLYEEKDLPGWLADSLINAFYYFAPCSVWAQAKPPIGNWCKPEDGVFALNESPRSCPQTSTLSNMAMAGPVLSMFFPDLALSSLRAVRAGQNAQGQLPFRFGPWMEMAAPGIYGAQEVMAPGNYMTQLYWQWKATGDDSFLKEFYQSAKRKLEYSFGLNPDLGLSQIIAMPKGGGGEWFEDQPMSGYVVHAGGFRLVAAEMMREWAERMGDQDYAVKLDAMIGAGKEAMQKYLWRGDHYLVFKNPQTGKEFDAFFSPQLNGQYFAHLSGVPKVFPEANVEKVLAVMREKVCKISKLGMPPNFSNADGSVWTGKSNLYLTGKYIYNNHEVIWISILAIYEGHKDFGLDLLRKNLELGYCHWGYMWDGVNCCSAQGDTGEVSYGWDYWFNYSIWMAAAALAGGDFSALLKPGGLVNSMFKAGSLA